MRSKISFAFLAFAFVGASAYARPSTYNMTCAQAKNLVHTHGAVVMNYDYHSSAGHLYHRFVAHVGYCDGGDRTRPVWVKTKDTSRCTLLICESHSGR